MIRPRQNIHKILPNPCLDQIQNPQRVRILILTEQKLSYQQFSYLKKFTSLIKLDLSHNRISSFTQGFSFKPFTQLKTLFLHYNKFDKIKNLELLVDCNKLVYLTLFGNPIEESKARHFCINLISSLKLMDDKSVNEQQRHNGVFNFNKKQILNERVGFPLIQMPSPENSVQFLACVMREINIVKSEYLKVNKFIIIQRWWKSKLFKKKLYKQFLQQELISKMIQERNKSRQFQDQKMVHQQKSQDFKISILNKVSNKFKNNKRDFQETLQTNSSNLKIFRLFRTFIEGVSSFQMLLDQQPSLLCQKKYCIENGIKFKQFPTTQNKHLQIYVLPQNHRNYLPQKQKSKFFFPLVFYNNSHYILQLKHKSKQTKSQLKNIQGQNQNIKLTSGKNQFVQIDLSKSQKLTLIKKQYLKSKTSQTKNPFQFLFGYFVIRISSAAKIQKFWRGYLLRKNSNVLKKILQEKAAKKIQKWLRNLKFYHRQNFLHKTYQFLKTNNFSNIVMTLETFSKIVSKQKQKFRFGNLFKLPFQNCQFQMVQSESNNQFDKDQEITDVNYQKCYQLKLNCQRQPYPAYFSKFTDGFYLKTQTIQNSTCDFEQRSQGIIDLLIKGALSIKKFQKVIQIKDNKKEHKKYVRFEYSSKNEANQRKLLLCLQTYTFRTKKWIQFHSQDLNLKVKSIDIETQIKNNHFIKIVPDTDKKSNLFEKIKQYTKSTNYQGVVNWNIVKLRYYQGTTDYSAILLCGIHKNNGQSQQKSEKIKHGQEDVHSYSQRKRFRQLKSLKTLYAKMVLKNLDTQIFMPSEYNGSETQNLMSFSVRLKEDPSKYNLTQMNTNSPYKKKLTHYYNSLHHDNSQFSIDNFSILSKSVHSQGSSLPLRKKFDQSQINDLSMSYDPLMQLKKSQISKNKQTHKDKLEMIIELKKKNHDSLRKEYHTQRQNNHKLLRQKSQSTIIQNINKVKKIQQTRKAKIQQSFQIDKFQNKFLRKGNLSIQNQMRRFEKSRSQSKQQISDQNKISIKKSARYQQTETQINKQPMTQGRRYLRQSAKKKVLKTQLKQFSINLSDGVDFQNSLMVQNQLINASKKLSGRQALSSAVSEKISKLYKQKSKQFLKSQGKESVNYGKKFDKNKEATLNQSKSFQEQIIKQQSSPKQIYQRMLEDEKKKQMKKKRTVHSVFPEEYYPLKDSHQIGFNLPKIHSQK